MSIPYIVTALSLAVTGLLVDNGYAYGPGANVVGATNATPIVVTLDADLRIPEGSDIHVVIADVAGNTAANGTRIARVLTNGPTTLALYENAPTGPSPVAGAGAYTGGGTLQSALTDGRILLGPQYVYATSAPPRIVIVPRASGFDQKPTPSAGVAPNGSVQAMLSRQWQWTAAQRWLVEVWGSRYIDGAMASDPDADWVYTETLRDAVIQSMAALMLGSFKPSAGVWEESLPDSAKVDIVGRRFTFDLLVNTPVLVQPAPIAFVPPGVTGTITVYTPPDTPSGPDAITIPINPS